MTGAMAAFVIAVGAVAAIFYLLMGRAERRAERKASGDSSGSAGANYVGGADSWTASSWFGGFHNSGGSFDSGGGDSGGGGGGGGD